jgi:hypothetical protein
VQAGLWGGCAAAIALAGVSMLAERRRDRRTNPDRVGFMPWTLILIFSILSAAVLAALALKA